MQDKYGRHRQEDGWSEPIAQVSSDTEIIMCPNCKGKGEIRVDVGTHNSDWESYTCERCKGFRLLEVYTERTVEITERILEPVDHVKTVVDAYNELHK